MAKPGTLPPRYNGKHPGGRPTKCTPELVAKLAGAIADGLPDEFACDLVGITHDTFIQWKKDPTLPQFSEDIKTAVAARLQERMNKINAGLPGWQGTAWILERRWSRDFARPELQIAINQDVNVNVNHSVTMMAESDLVRLSQLVREVESECIPDSESTAELPQGSVEPNTNK